jgi:hypothetical protein
MVGSRAAGVGQAVCGVGREERDIPTRNWTAARRKISLSAERAECQNAFLGDISLEPRTDKPNVKTFQIGRELGVF